jgi:glucose-1-phosphate adenylyltransferase
MKIDNRVLAIVLGGGQGSRLAPLTESRSKPAVPIGGKYRLVDIPISNCLNSDITRIFVLTQFNSASLNTHIKNTYNFSFMNRSFIDILAAEQTPNNPSWFQGTSDAVRQCMPHFLNHKFDYALILSGDQLYQMDFNLMLKEHIKNKAEISIATLPVSKKEASEFGILKTDHHNRITSFIEKPTQDLVDNWKSGVSKEMQVEGKEYLASMGIYIFNRELLIELMSNPNTMDFGKEIMPQVINTHKVSSYQFEGYWTDIGNIDSFFEANIGLTNENPNFKFFDDATKTFTRPQLLPPSKIFGTALENVLLSEGCILRGSKIERSVIGTRTRIGKETVVTNSYVMGADFFQNKEEFLTQPKMGIGERCYINNAIIDKNCFIGNDVNINGGKHLMDSDDGNVTVKDGIVVVKKGAVIPNGFTL